MFADARWVGFHPPKESFVLF
jgi:hypothetical protein